METKRITTRAMLQRVVNLTKHAHDLQTTSRLTVPLWNNYNLYRYGSTNIDYNHGLSTNSSNPSPRRSASAFGLERKFDFFRAEKLLQIELNRQCSKISKTLHYDPQKCLDLVRDLSQQLRRILKSDTLNNIRYKIIVLVTIVQAAPDRQIHQSMAIASRCLWNPEKDGSITVQAKFGYDMIAIATAFIVYTD